MSVRIYLDVCCLSRLFDDQSQSKVHLEAEAIHTILDYCNSGNWTLVSSPIVDSEISRIPDEDRKQKVMALSNLSTEIIEVDERLEKRALELESLGFKAMDALHISCAEKARVDVFLTTDEKLLRRALREHLEVGVSVANPLTWLIETGEK